MAQLNDKASRELDNLLLPFFRECDESSEVIASPIVKQQWRDDDLPSWALCLVLIACSALLGAICAFLAHL